uniref:Secreted protein n=1 Tax=Globodera pallida TaxID=36090 RepID=A0A183CSE2_GLOPA
GRVNKMNRSNVFAVVAILIAILTLFRAVDCRATHGTCIHQGKHYREGEEWIVHRSFVMRCFVHYNHNRWETKVRKY